MDPMLITAVTGLVLLLFVVAGYCLMKLLDDRDLDREDVYYTHLMQKAFSWFMKNPKWDYQEYVDPITDVTSVWACVAANKNVVVGNSRGPGLTVKWEDIKDPSSITVYISFYIGQDNSIPVRGARTITIRFDSETPYEVRFKTDGYTRLQITNTRECYKFLNLLLNSYRLAIRYKGRFGVIHTEVYELIPPTVSRKDLMHPTLDRKN